jgi:hypothetical protein
MDSGAASIMPYHYVVLVATVVLALRHARSSHASRRSKGLVGGLAAFAVLAPGLWPSFLPGAALVLLACPLLQWATCIYVILHQTVWTTDDQSGSVARPLRRADSADESSEAERGHQPRIPR